MRCVQRSKKRTVVARNCRRESSLKYHWHRSCDLDARYAERFGYPSSCQLSYLRFNPTWIGGWSHRRDSTLSAPFHLSPRDRSTFWPPLSRLPGFQLRRRRGAMIHTMNHSIITSFHCDRGSLKRTRLLRMNRLFYFQALKKHPDTIYDLELPLCRLLLEVLRTPTTLKQPSGLCIY
jgi:hypothetical protein